MKKLCFIILLIMRSVHPSQKQEIIESYPTQKDMSELVRFGMYDQIAKVCAGCRDQAEIEKLRRKYGIDAKELDYILGNERNLNPKTLKQSELDFIEKTKINTVIHFAAMKGDVRFVRDYFSDPRNKGKISLQTGTGHTAYRIAMEMGQKDVASVLRNIIFQNAQWSADEFLASGDSWSSETLNHKSVETSSTKSLSSENKPLICFLLFLVQLSLYLF